MSDEIYARHPRIWFTYNKSHEIPSTKPHLKFNERKKCWQGGIKGREGLYIQSFQMITKCGLSNWFSSC